MRGSFNKSLENPRDGVRSIDNGFVFVSSIIHYTAVKASDISITWFHFYCRLKQNTFGYLEKWKNVSSERLLRGVSTLLGKQN